MDSFLVFPEGDSVVLDSSDHEFFREELKNEQIKMNPPWGEYRRRIFRTGMQSASETSIPTRGSGFIR